MSVQAGMAAVDVVGILGPPTMVMRGPGGREVWLWDGVSSGSVGTAGPVLGVLAGEGVGTASAVSIVVRFDAELHVSSIGLRAAARRTFSAAA